MALRDKLARRAYPYLEPGEQIQGVFPAQSGPSPYWILLSALIVVFAAGYAIVVVTDRSIVVLRAGRILPTFPNKVQSRGPRTVYLGRPSGLWGSIRLDRKYWVHKRFHKDVTAAEAILQQLPPQGPPPGPLQYGPPPGARYGAPAGAPQYGLPAGGPQYGAPQYGPPADPPQYGAPQYGPPQYGAPQYGPPQYGPPPGVQYGAPAGAPQYGPPAGPPSQLPYG